MRSHSKLFLKALNLKTKKAQVFFRENLVALYYFRSFIYDFFHIIYVNIKEYVHNNNSGCEHSLKSLVSPV